MNCYRLFRSALVVVRVPLVALAVLATTCAADVLIDFETANPFSGGTLSTDRSYAGQGSLWVAPGDALIYEIPEELRGQDLLVTMKVYDLGKWIDLDVPGRPGTVYGPRWGVSAGDHGIDESIGAGILQMQYANGIVRPATGGYRMQEGSERFGEWPGWAEHPRWTTREHFAVEGTGGSNVDDEWIAGEGSGGEWTHWTFLISGDGLHSDFYLNDLYGLAYWVHPGMDIGGPPTQVWLYGGDGLALGGMYVDDIRITVPEALARVKKIENSPTVDGQLDDIWYANPAKRISSITQGNVESEDDLEAGWRGLWDEERFYLFVEITDQHLEDSAGTGFSNNDTVEVRFNMGGAGEANVSRYLFPWNKPATVTGAGSLDGVEMAQADTATGWTVEVSIPWSSLTSSPVEQGLGLGFDVAVIDNDGGGDYDSITFWHSKSEESWSSSASSGTVELWIPFDGVFRPEVEPLEPVYEIFEGTVSEIKITATHVNGPDTLTIRPNGVPPDFATLTDNGDGTAVLRIDAKPGDAGRDSFFLTVSDGESEEWMLFYILVRDPAVQNHPPRFDNEDPIWMYSARTETVYLRVVDPDGFRTTLTPTDLPDWASFEAHRNGGALILSPDIDEASATRTLTFLATDENGATTTLEFTVEVVSIHEPSIVYLDPVSGDLSNDGSYEAPWPSLEEVMAAGKRFPLGIHIYLRDGDHGSPVLAGHSREDMTIQPEDGHSPMLRQLHFVDASGWTVSNLTIAPVTVEEQLSEEPIIWIGEGCSDITIQNCDIYSLENTDGLAVGELLDRLRIGILSSAPDTWIIKNRIANVLNGVCLEQEATSAQVWDTVIEGVAGTGIRVVADDARILFNTIREFYGLTDEPRIGIQGWSGGVEEIGEGAVSRVLLRGNLIIDTIAPERAFQPVHGVHGIELFDGWYEEWVLESNVVITDMWTGIHMRGARNCMIVHNTVVQNPHHPNNRIPSVEIAAHESGEDGAGNVVVNNLVAAFGELSGTEDSNNLVIGDYAAQFVDYPNYDLRLRITSPAVNSGTSAYGLNWKTIENSSRAPPFDIGAYEWENYWHGFYAPELWAHTKRFLGMVYVGFDPWVGLHELNTWLYVEEGSVTESGGWVFSPAFVPAMEVQDVEDGASWAGYKLEGGWAITPLGLVYPATEEWLYVDQFQSWTYLPSPGIVAGGVWLYAVNLGRP